MAGSSGRRQAIWAFLLLSLLPILTGAAASALGVATQVWTSHAKLLQFWAIVGLVVTAFLAVGKAAYEFNWSRSRRSIRYDSLRELNNRISQLMDITDDMALEDPSSLHWNRQGWIERAADAGCAALTALVPENRDARAVVYEIDSHSGVDQLVKVGQFGRADPPRVFRAGTPAGDEALEYLQGSHREPELYRDTKRQKPANYDGDATRYRTFVRAAIYSGDIVYGMLTVDAPRPRSLTEGDRDVAGLVARQLSIAFSIAADPATEIG